jgi:hyperosmotically inducible protein
MPAKFAPRKLLGTTMIVLGLSGFTSVASAEPDDLNQSPYVTEFNALDIDGSGSLSKTEASKDRSFNKSSFQAADVDSDEVLSQSEYADYKSQSQNKEVGRVVDDSAITAKIKANIIKEEGLRGLQISVETHKGIVQLSGFVDNKTQIVRAEEIAQSIRGVKSVRNSLVVKS